MLVDWRGGGRMNTREIAAVLAVTLPVHAVGEGLAVWWLGTGLPAGLFVAAGTALHHVVDSGISLAVFRLVLPVLRPQGAQGS
jgi:hypothetical protein